MTINQLQDELIEEISAYDDWMEKYEYIIQLGKDLPLLKNEMKTDDKLIKGCQSKVWLHAEQDGEKVKFYADSDAIITKGIVSLLISILSGQKATDIANADLYFLDKIGLKNHLSPTRANGLASMVKQMKMYGLAFAKMNQL